MASRSIAWLCAASLLVACAPETDRSQYQVGERGTVTLRNHTGATLYLGGCGHFDYEQRIGDEWVWRAPDQVCFWEGFAQPVVAGGALHEPFEARAPGTWRLRYPVGLGCSEAAPLDAAHCRALVEITSNEFEVEESGCVVSGCSGQVCADQPWATTCEWQPRYACFQAARCGRFAPDGACAWEPTPELQACLADPPQPGW
jgi:hypothetical protein